LCIFVYIRTTSCSLFRTRSADDARAERSLSLNSDPMVTIDLKCSTSCSRLSQQISANIYARTHVHVHVHTRANTCKHTRTHTCTHVKIHTHTELHQQKYSHAHTHAHTHTHCEMDCRGEGWGERDREREKENTSFKEQDKEPQNTQKKRIKIDLLPLLKKNIHPPVHYTQTCSASSSSYLNLLSTFCLPSMYNMRFLCE